ncbi:TRAM domain-containing protein [Candidatus Woesearchaeota archaeon]|nr:TRAM domain-containing protein [Candidatus Woesearchaeota archaeon]
MNRKVPVSVNQELDVKIEAIGEKGDGIAKSQGFVLFIPGVKQGDEVRVRVTKVLPKVGFAEVIGSAGSGSGESSDSGSGDYSEENNADSDNFGEEESESTEDPNKE